MNVRTFWNELLAAFGSTETAQNETDFQTKLVAAVTDAQAGGGAIDPPETDPTWTTVQAALDDIAARLALLEV